MTISQINLIRSLSLLLICSCEAFHGKRDTYNCSIDAYISNKSRDSSYYEALHGKRDTFERDIIIGGSLSFSPIVIFVV